MTEAHEKNNQQPHIVVFKDEDDELNQYFVSVEQELMLESGNLTAAIFYCLSPHYIFNLTYHKKSGDVWLFVQERVLGLPPKARVKHLPSSIVHFSGIQCTFEEILE